MNYDNYISGDYDSNSPVNQKENDIEGFDFETLTEDDYITMKFGKNHVYSGFVTRVDPKEKMIFFDEASTEKPMWCYYRQIVKVGEIDINN